MSWVKKETTSRKEKPCDICNRPIKIGEKQITTTLGREDWDEWNDSYGSPYRTFYRHGECEKMWSTAKEILSPEEMDYFIGGTYQVIAEDYNSNRGELESPYKEFFDEIFLGRSDAPLKCPKCNLPTLDFNLDKESRKNLADCKQCGWTEGVQDVQS
ncbi:MAG: hypothetical protein ACYDAO_02480 [Thermoplasmataceae archaeon]